MQSFKRFNTTILPLGIPRTSWRSRLFGIIILITKFMLPSLQPCLYGRTEFIAWRLRHLNLENADGIKYFLWRSRISLDFCVTPTVKWPCVKFDLVESRVNINPRDTPLPHFSGVGWGHPTLNKYPPMVFVSMHLAFMSGGCYYPDHSVSGGLPQGNTSLARLNLSLGALKRNAEEAKHFLQ